MTILILVGLLLCPQKLRAEDSITAFDAANRLYAEGKFIEAAASYEKILGTGQASPAVYFNLGNAFFKSGQMGRAIAAYRQAQQMTPRDPDVRANLQFARNQVQGPTLRPGRLERLLGTLSQNEWIWLSAGAVWLTFGLLAVRQLWPSLAKPLRSWTLAAAAISLLVIGSCVLAFAANSTTSTVLVVVTEASVRNGPFEEAPNGFTVRDGAELRVLDSKGDWLQVTDGTRRVGWVKQDAVVSPTRS